MKLNFNHIRSLVSLVFFFSIISVQGQKRKDLTDVYDSNMSFSETKAKFKSYFRVSNSLILKDGSSISIGDTLKLGPSASKTSNKYETIMEGRNTLGAALLLEESMADTSYQNFHWVLEEISVTRMLGEIEIEMYLRNPDAKGLATKYVTISNISFLKGEVINPNRKLTRSEAIAKLKESKDLLDLEMITQEEYNKIKEELSPVIRAKN